MIERGEDNYVLGGPNITVNVYCIFLSEHETCAYRFAVIYETPISRKEPATLGILLSCDEMAKYRQNTE